MATKKFTTQQFMDAIKESGGNISVIAKRVGCQWHTADKFIKAHPTVLDAYNAENEAILDIAEGLITKNIKLASATQEKDSKVVDTTDAKWWLSKKRLEYKDSLEVSGTINIDIPEALIGKWIEILTRHLPSNS